MKQVSKFRCIFTILNSCCDTICILWSVFSSVDVSRSFAVYVEYLSEQVWTTYQVKLVHEGIARCVAHPHFETYLFAQRQFKVVHIAVMFEVAFMEGLWYDIVMLVYYSLTV